MMNKLFFIGITFAILGCADKKPTKKVELEDIDIKIEAQVQHLETKLKHTTFEEISKFVIASIFNQEVNNTLNSELIKDYYLVTYARKSDNTKWQFLVKFEGERAIWASNGGRWRTDPQDEKIYFEEKPDKVKITQHFSDGYSVVKEFKINTK